MPNPGSPSPRPSQPRRAPDARDPAGTPTLTVLGCDGSYPGPGGAGSGYLLEAAGVSLWLEAGPGTFAALQLVTDPGLVDALILSHEHPDHRSDVDAFAVWLREVDARRGGRAPRRPAVPVYAAPGVRERAYFGDDPALDWHEVEPAEHVVVRPLDPAGAAREPGSEELLVCSFSATDHGPPTLGLRVDVARPGAGPPGVGPPGAGPPPDPQGALAYSADTGDGWSVEELGTGIGTFLCEATYGASEEGSARHLSSLCQPPSAQAASRRR